MKFIDTIRNAVRAIMSEIAMLINEASAGRITPMQITITATLMHVVIAYAITQELYPAAALMLVVFGLMDALDGALARLQGSESERGVVFDATTDRIKEVMLYAAIAYVFALAADAFLVLVTVIALGGSIVVSYVRAKAETAIISLNKKASSSDVNKLHRGGLFSFEVRMTVLVLGLITERLDVAVVVIAIGVWLTMLWRADQIWRALATK